MKEKPIFLQNDLFVAFLLIPCLAVLLLLGIIHSGYYFIAAFIIVVLLGILGRTKISVGRQELKVTWGFFNISLLRLQMSDINSVRFFDMEWYGINKPVYKISDPDKQKKGFKKLPAVLVSTTGNNYAIVPRVAKSRETLLDALRKVKAEGHDST